MVGLSWVSRNPLIGGLKSARLQDLEPVLRLPNCRFIDLQYGDTLADRQAIEREFGIDIERVADVDNTNDLEGLAGRPRLATRWSPSAIPRPTLPEPWE